ncbi:ABC transporter ATP-binding protein [Elongatibacter sediminis]|uniref:ABC transporter ATP-binding protein n=1 Tax=Elongatibacter sediminis TaxID=3119006 RepID=A0AAW9RFM2_9GAMM
MSDDVLVKVEGVSKKFCRSLKRSMWYGVQDVASELLGRQGGHDQLRKNEFWAVDDVSFELRRGECLGLIGPNGAGKSTLLKMLNGLIKPDKGRITMRGRVGALIELGAGFNPILTARENIYVNGSVLGFTKKEIDRKFDAIVDFAEIEEFIDTPVQSFSSGMKVRLGFAVAAQMEPDILLIDEVLAVGDVGFRMKCFNRILKLKNLGTVIVLVSHSMLDVHRVCSTAAVISPGKFCWFESVSRAVCLYEELSLIPNTVQPRFVASPARVGKVQLFDSLGRPCSEFSTDDDILIGVEVGVEEPIVGARLVISVDSASGPLSSIGSPASGFELRLERPQNLVVFRLHNLPLLVGSYPVSVSLSGEQRTEIFDQVIHAVTINVVGPEPEPFGYGFYHIMKLEHGWNQIFPESVKSGWETNLVKWFQ